MKKTNFGLQGLLFAAGFSVFSAFGCATLPSESRITKQDLPLLVPQNVVSIEIPKDSKRKLILGYSTKGDGAADKFFSYDMPNPVPGDIGGQPVIGFYPNSYFPLLYNGKKSIFGGYPFSPDRASFMAYSEGGDMVIGFKENGKIADAFFFKIIGADNPDSSGNYQDYFVRFYAESSSR